MATAKNQKRRVLYDELAKQVDIAADGELEKSRAGLLLWFFSVVKGYDEADALEFICDGDEDGGIDALLLETHEMSEGVRYVLTALQSKYPKQPSMIGERDVAGFIGRGDRLRHVEHLKLLVEPPGRAELRRLVQRYRLEERIESDTVTFKLHLAMKSTRSRSCSL